MLPARGLIMTVQVSELEEEIAPVLDLDLSGWRAVIAGRTSGDLDPRHPRFLDRVVEGT